MKFSRTLALASLAAAANAAVAQSSEVQGPVSGDSVQMFGVADIYMGYGTGSLADRTSLSSGGSSSSRLGFRGVEDLGGGMAAGFWLEAGFNIDNGTMTSTSIDNQPGSNVDGLFARRATVSLINPWGELRVGRDYTATYRNRADADPFFTNGVGASQVDVGTIQGPTATRASNMVGYFLPNKLGGFFGEAQYYMGENADYSDQPDSNDGNGYAARFGWGHGPFSVAVSAGRTHYASTAEMGDTKVANVAAAYDFGPMKLTAGYYQDKVESIDPVTATGYIVGATVPYGASEFKAAYSSYGTDEPGEPRANKIALGYAYNLSKRTQTYVNYAYLKNKGDSDFALNGSITGPNESSQGVDFGIRHTF